MNKKKFLAAVSAAAVSAAMMIPAVNANCTTNSATGVVTWDFASYNPSTAEMNIGDSNTEKYFTFGAEAMSEIQKSEIEEVKDTLIIRSKNGNGVGNKINNSGIYLTFGGNATLYYTTTVAGTFSISGVGGSSNASTVTLDSNKTPDVVDVSADLGISESFSKEIKCSANEMITVNVKRTDGGTGSMRASISNVTFTPATADQIYTFNASFNQMNGMNLNVNYTDANGTETITKALSELWGNSPVMAGEAEAVFGVKITGVPANTTIHSVKIAGEETAE